MSVNVNNGDLATPLEKAYTENVKIEWHRKCKTVLSKTCHVWFGEK